MQARVRRFRIEGNDAASGAAATAFPAVAVVSAEDADQRHREIMESIAQLRAAVSGDNSPLQAREQVKELTSLTEALSLKVELQSIQEAIVDTKRELATLHQSGFKQSSFTNVTDELDAIVSGTEAATEVILAAAEAIDERAGNLAASLKGDSQGMASDIQEQVVRVFEACNFQDLTGQRITKIVTAFRFIEHRVDRMVEIWGGIEAFARMEGVAVPKAEGDRALLNGPGLEGDEGRASQDDIDALFG